MDKPCEFCGSPTRLIVTDFYSRPDADEPVKTPCCRAQKSNMDYLRNRFDPLDSDKPDIDEISKL